jgi:MoaA/NifB/PqqE/SkfB family radical SAM enzyme
MSIRSKSKLINICSANPEIYYKDIMSLDDEMYEQFRLAKKRGLMPEYLSGPAYMMWEITSLCPQKCIYCYNSSHQKAEELTSKQLFDVAEQIIEAKPFNVCVTGGEPTTREEYFDLLRYLSSSGILIGTILSGVNITKAKALKIASCAKAIQISLDGSKAEIHDMLRQRQGSFEDAVNAIRYFVDFGVGVNISFAATKINIEDFPKFHEFVSKLGVATIRTQKLAISGRAKENENSIRPTKEQYDEFIAYINNKSNKKGLCKIEFGDPCIHIKSGLDYNLAVLARVSSTGNVGISPYFNIFFGNLKTESLHNIWEKMKNGWSNPDVIDILSKDTGISNCEIVDRMKKTLVV